MKRKSPAQPPAILEFRELSALLLEAPDLSAPELTKRPWRWGVFRKKIDRSEPFILKIDKNQEIPVTIPRGENEALYSALEREDYGDYKGAFRAGVTARDSSGASRRIESPSDLRKDAAFGGRGKDSGWVSEKDQIDQINAAILAARREAAGAADLIDDEALPPINIKLGNFTAVGVVRCEKVEDKPEPKADAVLEDAEKNGISWISLKSASSPNEMNQWGGLSQYKSEPTGSSDAHGFANFIRCLHPDGVPGGKAYYQTINSGSVAHKAIWGENSTQGGISNRGVNCIDAVIASKDPITLIPVGKGTGTYEFSVTSGKIWLDGEIPSGGWEPVFFARRGERDSFEIPRTRVGIFPKEQRKAIDASLGTSFREKNECKETKKDFTAIATVYAIDADEVLPGQDITNHPIVKGGGGGGRGVRLAGERVRIPRPLKAVVTSDTYNGEPLINFTFRSRDNARNWFAAVNDDFEGDWMYQYDERDGAANEKKAAPKKVESKVTAETRLLLGELFPSSPLEKWGLTEEYVTQVLGLPRPIIAEGRISEGALREIIREHLIFEGWWESAKSVVGSGVSAIKEKGESAADVFKAFGGDSKAVIAALWAAASDPAALADLLGKFTAVASRKAAEVVGTIKDVASKISKVGAAAAAVKALEQSLGFVSSAAKSISTLSGWKGLLAAASGYLGFEWLSEKIEPLKSKIEELTSGSGQVKEEVRNLVATIAQDEIANFVKEKLLEIGKTMAASAIEQLAGPAAWLKVSFEIFETSAWVLSKLSGVISTSRKDFSVEKVA
jgi:hypothetical protein